MSSLNKIHVEWHNETNILVNINKDENDWKKSLTSIKNYNVQMFWLKMIQHQEYKNANPLKEKIKQVSKFKLHVCSNLEINLLEQM
jgi:hypothetical protein